MTIALITGPAVEPLSLAEVKAHLRVDHDHEDALITDTLNAARQYCEFASGHKFITQAWRQYETCLPADRLVCLSLQPVQSVSAVTVFDIDGNPTVLAAQDIELIRGANPSLLRLSNTIDTALGRNGIEIDLIVGMGDLGVDVPDTIKRAILLLVAHWYEFRGAVSPADQPVSIPPGFEALMSPFKGARL